MKINRNEHPLDGNTYRIEARREFTHWLFRVMDIQGGLKKLSHDTNSELLETKQELEAPHYDKERAQSEWIDFINVLTAAALHAYGREIKPSTYLYGVNGEGRHSNVFEQLEEKVADIQDDVRAIEEVYRLGWSFGIHQIGINVPALFTLFDKADHKFRSNYPGRYYSGVDAITGTFITEDHRDAAFTHYTKALKIIRAHVQRTLTPEDYVPYDNLIRNWRSSEASLAQLKQELQTKKPKEQLESGIVVPSAEVTMHIDRTKNQGILFPAPALIRAA